MTRCIDPSAGLIRIGSASPCTSSFPVLQCDKHTELVRSIKLRLHVEESEHFIKSEAHRRLSYPDPRIYRAEACRSNLHQRNLKLHAFEILFEAIKQISNWNRLDWTQKLGMHWLRPESRNDAVGDLIKTSRNRHVP